MDSEGSNIPNNQDFQLLTHRSVGLFFSGHPENVMSTLGSLENLKVSPLNLGFVFKNFDYIFLRS